MRVRVLFLGLPICVALACAPAPNTSPPPEPTPATTGILVMAHGGDPDWNASVDEALNGLRARAPLALAFGMADRSTLQAGVDSLAARGVERVSVVRMFLSGRSFEDQTRYLLRLSDEPPAFFLHHPMPAGEAGPSEHGPTTEHGTGGPQGGPSHGTPPPIETRGLDIATQTTGLMDWSGVGAILRERAEAAGAQRGAGLMVIGHGMGDDDENREVLESMARAVDGLRDGPWGPVEVETLREDWPEARAGAEKRIRKWISESAMSGPPVVIPFRLSGFGPYAEVLEGLDYLPAAGLLPPPSIVDWVEETAREVACREGWLPATGGC